jgi:hypothetical protein
LIEHLPDCLFCRRTPPEGALKKDLDPERDRSQVLDYDQAPEFAVAIDGIGVCVLLEMALGEADKCFEALRACIIEHAIPERFKPAPHGRPRKPGERRFNDYFHTLLVGRATSTQATRSHPEELH